MSEVTPFPQIHSQMWHLIKFCSTNYTFIAWCVWQLLYTNYHLSYCYVAHMRLCTRLSPPFCTESENMWAGALERGYEYPWQLLQKIWGSFVFVIRCTIACDPIHMTWQAGLIMHSLCWIPYLCSWWVNVAISIKFQFQGGDVMVWNDVLCNSEGATVLYHVISTHRLWNVAIIVEAELLNYFGWSAQVQEAKMASHLAGLGCKDCEQKDQT